MSAQMTPGPWAVEDPMGNDAGDDVWIVEAGKQSGEWRPIATVCSCDPDDDSGLPKIGPVERDRNAKAIAALPAMVEALKKVAQINRPSCERANAESLLMLLDIKVDHALAALKLAGFDNAD